MRSSAYQDLLFGTQALRRRVEADALDLGGALGVRAQLLPHQVASVRRVLTAPRVRHLLADEVGLGKTVQAIMVLTALRRQDPDFRALVVVPNELRAQWRDELWTRGHEVPSEEASHHRRLALSWPDREGSDALVALIDEGRFHALVVDEFHDLNRDIQQRILERAPRFRHLLLISATPPFQNPERRADLLRMLEPERVAALEDGGDAPTERLLARERLVSDLLGRDITEDGWLDADLVPPPEGDRASLAAEAHCVYRRVVRTRREDYRDYMPIRRHTAVTVEPTAAEEDRNTAFLQYLKHVPSLETQFDPDRLAQRARSPVSLKQRVSFLLRRGHEREGLLAQLDRLLDRKLGDSRFEALVELLGGIWRDDPSARVLIAAHDNLTVDALVKQLPLTMGEVGPPGERRALEARPLRRGMDVVWADSLGDDETTIERHVAEFARGEANLLVASDVGKVGLNLQYTRHVVLYDLPWNPLDVEQWIGRVDRIGNAAVRTGGDELLPVEVYTIAQRGLVDQGVVKVLRASSVLERSISLESGRVQTILSGFQAAARGEVTDWGGLEAEALAIARANQELGSPLQAKLPWTREWAGRMHRRHVLASPIQPAPLRLDDETPLQHRERSVLCWLDALRCFKEYEIKRNPHAGVRTLHYSFTAQPGPKSTWPINTRALLREVFPTERDGHASGQVPFVVRRSDLRQPPRREVTLWEDARPKNLYFFNHGSPLHDDLVDAWIRLTGGQRPVSGRVMLPSGHPALEQLEGAVIAVMVATMDPGLRDADFTDAVVSGATFVPGGARAGEGDVQLIEAFRADNRLLRATLPAQLLFGGLRMARDGSWSVAPEAAVRALLDPDGLRAAQVPPKVFEWRPPGPSLEALAPRLAALESSLLRAGHQRWSRHLPELARELQRRRYLESVDASDRELVSERAVDRARERRAEVEAEFAAFDAAGGPRAQRGQLTRRRNAAARELEAALEQLARARVATLARRDWLDRAAQLADRVVLQDRRIAILHVKRAKA